MSLIQSLWYGARHLYRRLQGESRRHFRHRRRAANRRAFAQSLFRSHLLLDRIVPWRRVLALECLETRVLLTGGLVANNDSYLVSVASPGGTGPGVLANDVDPNPGAQMMAFLVSGPSHIQNFQLSQDGSFGGTGTGYAGPDSFTYYFRDTDGYVSNTATVSLAVDYAAQSATDLTKQVAIDPLDTSLQILGGASGAPATPQNLSLAYDSVAGQPDVVIEAAFQLNSTIPINDSPTGTLTFNGVQQPATYVNLMGMNGNSIDLSYQLDTSALPTGRYAYSLTLSSPNMTAPATVSGAVNVVNDSAGPVGKGWDIPGLYHLYPNSASGVPAGVLLTTGGGQGWYFTSGSGSSFTSPNGPFAFDTLTSVNGGGWQLVDKFGDEFNFNSGGYETSRVDRNTETDTYNWSAGNLTSIVDPFGRSVAIGSTAGQLSSVSDFAGNVWTIAHSGAFLSSVTEPYVTGGSPVWQFGYTGNYLSSETDPNGNPYSFTLDAHHRLSGSSLPGGGGTSDGSEQSMAYGGATQSGAPYVTPSASVQTTVTDALHNSTAMTTDVFGNPLVVSDALGNKTTYQRDANGLVTQMTQPPPVPGGTAPVTTYTYDSLGNETSATGANPTYGTYTFNQFSEKTRFVDSNNDAWTWSYDTHGNLIQTEDPLQNIVSYTVDSFGNPLTMTTPAPNDGAGTVTTSYAYDSYERLVKTTWADNSTRLVGYDADDRPISTTDENGHVSKTNLDALGRIVSTVDAMNGVVSETYDKNGNVLTTSDQMGNVTANTWNSRNELVQQVLPDPDGSGPLTSPVWQWSYDADGHKLTETDPMNRVTSWTWDQLGRMNQETLPDPDGSGPLTSPVITIGYDNLSRKVSEQDPSGTTTWAYANADVSQMTSMTLPDPDGTGPETSPVWTYSFDTLGRNYKTTDPMGHSRTTSFDADGRTLSVLDNLGHGPTYAYGHVGELLTTTDALNHASSDQYDTRFRLVQTTDANGGVTQIQLDPAGNRVAVIDPDNNKTSFSFDPLNRETSETDARNFTRSFSYDASSDPISETDKDGRVRNFVFDNLHRETAEDWMNGNTVAYAISTAYDADNEVTSQSDPDSSYALTLDNLGRTLTVDNSGTPSVPHVVLTSGYDSASDRTSLSATINGTPDFLNNYSFDADQRLTDETQQGQSGGNGVDPKQVTFGYNALGQFVNMARYNFVGMGPMVDLATTGLSYDGANRLTGMTFTYDAGQHSIDSYAWTLDNADRITSVSSTADGTASYGYDPTDQLTSASYTGAGAPPNATYSFDPNGNRTMTGYQTGTDNLTTSDGTFNYQFDGEGNRTVRTRISNDPASDYQTKYTYDYRNRLTDEEYFDNSGTLTKHVHYVYDTMDRQIGEQIDDTGNGTYDRTERFAFDGSQPALQFDGNNNLTERLFVGLAQEPIATPGQAGATQWVLADNLGTPRYVVGDNSAVLDHVVGDAFGQVVSQTNAADQPWQGFAGGHADPNTGDVLNGQRRYDAGTGGWEAQDPIGFAGGDANPGRYAANSPTNAVDSSGLMATSVTYGVVTFGQGGMALSAAISSGGQTTMVHLFTPGLFVGQQVAVTGTASGSMPMQLNSGWTMVDYAAYAQTFMHDPAGMTLTGMYNPSAAAQQAAYSGMGQYYLNNAGYAHQALQGLGWLGGLTSYALGALEGQQLNQQIMANAQAPNPGQNPGQQFTQLVNDHFDKAMIAASIGDALAAGGGGGGGCGPNGEETCFVAGTQVAMASVDSVAEAGMATVGAVLSGALGGGLRFSTCLVAAAGLAGWQLARDRRRREEESAAQEAAIAALFGEPDDRWEADDLDRAVHESQPRGAAWYAAVDRLCAEEGETDGALDLTGHSTGCAVAVDRPQRAIREFGRPRTERPQPITSRRGKKLHPTSGKRYSTLGTAWLVACLALASWLGWGGAERDPSYRWVANSPAAAVALPTQNIELIRVGQRVVGENPDLAANDHSTATAVDPATWRLVRLHGEDRWNDGTLDTIEVETLQPLSWIYGRRASVGRSVPIPADLVEMGMREGLRARVTAIEPCPAITDGPGHVVLTTISHLNRYIFELTVEEVGGRRETIKPTGFHKFYSDTHRTWVSAADLRHGERLRGLRGPITLVDSRRAPGIERVYNMTIEGQHVFHVSTLGTLVHNTCPPGGGSQGPWSYGPDPDPGSSGELPGPSGNASGDFMDEPVTPPAPPGNWNITPPEGPDPNAVTEEWSQLLPPGLDGPWPPPPPGGPWNNPVK